MNAWPVTRNDEPVTAAASTQTHNSSAIGVESRVYTARTRSPQ